MQAPGCRGCANYCVFFGSSLVAVDEEPLAPPLGVAVEPLGEDDELPPEAEPLTEPEAEPPVEPPEDDLSLSASDAALLEELEGLVLDEGVLLDEDALGELGDEALGELELELEPALGELGEDGVDDALLEPLAPGALEVLLLSLSPQAARPRAIAIATASVESLMYSSKLGTNSHSSKPRTGRKPLIRQGSHPVRRTLCLRR
jgi:hypothetical protein